MADIQNFNRIGATGLSNQILVIDSPSENDPTGSSNHGQSNVSSTYATAAQDTRKKAFVKIIEQPASKALRFRYECEGRLAGSLPGANSTNEKKTFPTIEIVGYKGRALVVVSCVTKDEPYKAHPHNLVGKDGCKKGVCVMEVNLDTMRAVFCNLGVQCVKRKDIEQSLRLREEIRVDPFLCGFAHKMQPNGIDLNCVRLCFQVFLKNEQGRFTIPLAPIVSDVIYDKKAMAELVICSICSCTSTVNGGKEIILLCEKIIKEDISIRFYEEKDGHTNWEAYADFRHSDIHKQTAIKFRTPSYKTLEIEQPVTVFIQLKRPSDGTVSEPIPFEYLPITSDPIEIKRKRLESSGSASTYMMKQVCAHPNQKHENVLEQGFQNGISNQMYQDMRPISIGSPHYGNDISTPVNLSEFSHQNHSQQNYLEYNNCIHQKQQHQRHTQHHSQHLQQQTITREYIQTNSTSVHLNNLNNNLISFGGYQPAHWNISTSLEETCRGQGNMNHINSTSTYPAQQSKNYNRALQNGEQDTSEIIDLVIDWNSAELKCLKIK